MDGDLLEENLMSEARKLAEATDTNNDALEFTGKFDSMFAGVNGLVLPSTMQTNFQSIFEGMADLANQKSQELVKTRDRNIEVIEAKRNDSLAALDAQSNKIDREIERLQEQKRLVQKKTNQASIDAKSQINRWREYTDRELEIGKNLVATTELSRNGIGAGPQPTPQGGF